MRAVYGLGWQAALMPMDEGAKQARRLGQYKEQGAIMEGHSASGYMHSSCFAVKLLVPHLDVVGYPSCQVLYCPSLDGLACLMACLHEW